MQRFLRSVERAISPEDDTHDIESGGEETWLFLGGDEQDAEGFYADDSDAESDGVLLYEGYDSESDDEFAEGVSGISNLLDVNDSDYADVADVVERDWKLQSVFATPSISSIHDGLFHLARGTEVAFVVRESSPIFETLRRALGDKTHCLSRLHTAHHPLYAQCLRQGVMDCATFVMAARKRIAPSLQVDAPCWIEGASFLTNGESNPDPEAGQFHRIELDRQRSLFAQTNPEATSSVERAVSYSTRGIIRPEGIDVHHVLSEHPEIRDDVMQRFFAKNRDEYSKWRVPFDADTLHQVVDQCATDHADSSSQWAIMQAETAAFDWYANEILCHRWFLVNGAAATLVAAAKHAPDS